MCYSAAGNMGVAFETAKSATDGPKGIIGPVLIWKTPSGGKRGRR